MSELRIGLVAEGPTDVVVIEAALRAFLEQPFVLTQLQPEPSQPQMGSGWGGVLKWCQAFRQAGYAALEDDPKLEGFDLLILHLDADVAGKSYADYGPAVAQMAVDRGLPPMPIAQPCPPPSATVAPIHDLLRAWLGVAMLGPKTVVCIPSKATEAWLAAALLSNEQDLMTEIECEMNIAGILAGLPKAQRVRKSPREYSARAAALTFAWEGSVKQHCSQARDFEVRAVKAIT
ncbi:MAG: hypothetical protein HZB40_21170 [Rhodocyclales bacterium]|nr:hypothetical protein [Rhodocyclales bacterium]